jgi:hypothetical protein
MQYVWGIGRSTHQQSPKFPNHPISQFTNITHLAITSCDNIDTRHYGATCCGKLGSFFHLLACSNFTCSAARVRRLGSFFQIAFCASSSSHQHLEIPHVRAGELALAKRMSFKHQPDIGRP